jgi:hypothetical protein
MVADQSGECREGLVLLLRAGSVGASQLPDVEYTGNSLRQNEFCCNFGFRQEVTDGSLLPLGDDAFTPFGDSTTTTCDVDNPCYIVAGANDVRPVQVTIDSVNPGISGNQDPATDLIRDAQETDNPGYNSVFTNFPGLESSEVRNPYDI